MMTTGDLHIGYVRTEDGGILVQIPDDNQWGFLLASDDQSWPGGFGVASSWEPVQDGEVSEEDRDRLGWILDEHRPAPASLGFADRDAATEASALVRSTPAAYDLEDGSWAAAHDDAIGPSGERSFWGSLRDGRLVRLERADGSRAWRVVG